MIIEIKGAQFINKGAELMIYAIMQGINYKFHDVKYCMLPNDLISPYEKYSALGIMPKYPNFYKGFPVSQYGKIIPYKIRKSYGVIIDQEVDVILDASGFLYSDQFGYEKCKYMAMMCKKWNKAGKKIILLPQAFGPFETKKNKKYIYDIIEYSDLIYARESTSYEYLLSINSAKNNIRISPDFTCNVLGVDPENKDYYENKICVIPNNKMIEKTHKLIGESYLEFLWRSIDLLQENNKDVIILVHEGVKDIELTSKIVKKSKANIDVIKEDDALKVKGILGACYGTIGSRFHGLVSALSQGVPSIGTGWSHKYKMLFNDYDFDEGLYEINSPYDDLEKKMSILIDPIIRKRIAENLEKRAVINKKKVDSMWSEIYDLIKFYKNEKN